MLELVYDSLRPWMRSLALGSEGGRAFECDGVLAAIVPAAAERSVLNSVVYESAAALERAYDELAAAYEAAEAKWTVWVRPGDAEAATLLAGRGHVLDAEPQAMARRLDEPPARPDLELDLTGEGRMADVGALNDLAYGYDGSFTRALAGVTIERGAVYVARSGGTPVACLLTLDHGSNADVEWVAVAPEARGRGLSRKLLAHALADAAERGMETSTLVATRLGQPVYERLGFAALGGLQMWERRR